MERAGSPLPNQRFQRTCGCASFWVWCYPVAQRLRWSRMPPHAAEPSRWAASRSAPMALVIERRSECMRILVLVLLCSVGSCARNESPAPAKDTSAYEKDCIRPPDSTGACVLRDQGVH
jgi:hypothetical protein